MKEREIIANGVTYEIVELLAKGKGGYSYLAKTGDTPVIVKEIHYEPCDYYQFEENKLDSELRDYQTLRDVGILMPELIYYNQTEQFLIKEYIPGNTLAQIVANEQIKDNHIKQISEMCKKLYPINLNIDYFPTNFVDCKGTLYYIDYECNPYSDEWNFKNWGIWFLANKDGMKEFIETGSQSLLLENGKPIYKGYEEIVTQWLTKV